MRKYVKQLYTLVIAVTVLVTLVPAGSVQALTSKDIQDINNYKPWYDPDDTVAPCTTAVGGGTTVVTNDSENAIAQIIIGIAKTDNLDRNAATIGVMVGMTESGLRNLANTNVPVSLNNPNKQGTGSDHDSVGVFQQRPNSGWSTIATGDAADSNQDAVYQLMDPAYAAEAFFGSPSGSNAPPALSKGLVDITDWADMDPWLAGQRVQGSFDASGGNYKTNYPKAQVIVNKFWDTVVAVPLPVPFTGGAANGSDGGSGTTASGCDTPPDLGTGTGDFTSTNTTAESSPYETVDQWLARVKEAAIINPPSAMFQQLCGAKTGGGQINCEGLCDYLQGALWGYANSGYNDANDQWKAELASGHGHAGDRSPPVGALLFYDTGAVFGHVAAYLGNNEVVSTDVGDKKSGTTGGVYIIPASDLEGGVWNLGYLGWSDPNFAGGKL